ncbi:hypothetical protein MXB_5313 [Myxobolus squamalis]|nr:hypothetical protein MXB_5313 [Myxobolus squamalis]
MKSAAGIYSGDVGSNEIIILIEDISRDTKDILDGRNFTRSEIMNIYQFRKIYNFCSISEKSMPLQNSEKDFTSLGICGSLLYENISTLFSEHFDHVKHKIAESFSSFLEIYMLEWNKALLSANTIDSVFSYMNRHWVKQQQTQTDKKIYKIYNV